MAKVDDKKIQETTFVAKDRLWRDYVEKSAYAAKKWSENWGFLAGNVSHHVLDESKQIKRRSRLDSKRRTSAGGANCADGVSGGNTADGTASESPAVTKTVGGEADWTRFAPRSSRPVPRTTSQMIGWRSTDFACRLEKYGAYTRGKQSITRSLKWPEEAV